MGKREDYEAKTEQLIKPIIEANNLELFDVEYVKEGSDWYLRVYIDKEGGVTIDDCQNVSREFNEILDREDYIDDQYIFEVSSPGLMRPLKREKDYAKSIGKLIDVKLYKTVDNKKEYTGILKEYDKDNVVIMVDDKEMIIERSNLAMIRWAFVDEF
ncbi:MAG: ribosome maturation factor RimP [Eubacteriales bacterium]|nr:ribosome maturation factor RimP [Eubacteriales bacterium]